MVFVNFFGIFLWIRFCNSLKKYIGDDLIGQKKADFYEAEGQREKESAAANSHTETVKEILASGKITDDEVEASSPSPKLMAGEVSRVQSRSSSPLGQSS